MNIKLSILLLLVLLTTKPDDYTTNYIFYNKGKEPIYMCRATRHGNLLNLYESVLGDDELMTNLEVEVWWKVDVGDTYEFTNSETGKLFDFAFAKKNDSGQLVAIGIYVENNIAPGKETKLPVTGLGKKNDLLYKLAVPSKDLKNIPMESSYRKIPFTVSFLSSGDTEDYLSYEQVNMYVDENTPTFGVIPNYNPNHKPPTTESVRKADIETRKQKSIEYAQKNKVTDVGYSSHRKPYTGDLYPNCNLRFEYQATIDSTYVYTYSDGRISAYGYYKDKIFDNSYVRNMEYVKRTNTENPNSKILQQILKLNRGEIKDFNVKIVTCEDGTRNGGVYLQYEIVD